MTLIGIVGFIGTGRAVVSGEEHSDFRDFISVFLSFYLLFIHTVTIYMF